MSRLPLTADLVSTSWSAWAITTPNSRPLHVLRDATRRLVELPVLIVGVRCPIEAIMARRDAGQAGRGGRYEVSGPDAEVPEPVLRWQEEVHLPGTSDLEVDTSALSPAQCAAVIGARLRGDPPPSACVQLAGG